MNCRQKKNCVYNAQVSTTQIVTKEENSIFAETAKHSNRNAKYHFSPLGFRFDFWLNDTAIEEKQPVFENRLAPSTCFATAKTRNVEREEDKKKGENEREEA